MRKSWGLTEKILSGDKTIESRWYKNRYAPWGKVAVDDIVYFKNSGEAAKVRAKVGGVLQFEDLTESKVREILEKYGEEDGLEADELALYFERFKRKRYCILIFLKNVEEVPPFEVNKQGFGAMAAWLTADSLEAIKR
jgi:ASC-1-like (ASCH) protein